MWRKAARARRGVITTPAKWVSCESSCEAAVTTRCGLVRMELGFELVQLARVERLDDEQRVDEEAVAERRGQAARRGVGARDEAHVLEVGHHVADGGGRKIEP